MSIEVMRYVWKNSHSKGNVRLTLLAIADNANEVGDAFPGIDKLADKGNMSDRWVQDCIHELERMGEVQVFENVGTKTISGWTNLYRVVLPDVKQNEVRSPIDGSVVSARPIKPKNKKRKLSEGVNTASPLAGNKEVNTASPLKNDGVNTASPDGVNTASPKPSGESPDSNTNTFTPPDSAAQTENEDSLPDGKTSEPIPDGKPLPTPIEEESHPAVAPGWLGWGRPVDMSTLDLIPGDQYVEPPRQPYDCTEIDIAEMIAAWWEWVPVKPGLRGKPSRLADHMKVPTNREYARNLFERGVRPADFVKCLVEIKYSRDENDNPHRLAGKEMTFQYVCPIVDQWVAANRPDEMGLYTVTEPRFMARKPGMKYQIGEDIYARAKEFFIDTAPAYIPVAALTDPEDAGDSFTDTTDETDYEKWTPEEWARNGMPL